MYIVPTILTFFPNETTLTREDINGTFQNITGEVNNCHVASKILVRKEFPTYGGPIIVDQQRQPRWLRMALTYCECHVSRETK